MAKDIFNDYRWHSIMEPDRETSRRRIIRSLPITYASSGIFRRAAKDSSLLVHKSSMALWKVSGDRKSIEPVFKDDILTEDMLEGGEA